MITGMIEWIALGFVVFIVLLFIIRGFCLIGPIKSASLLKTCSAKKCLKDK